MEFLSIAYGVFLLSVLGIYWTVQHRWLRQATLLLASLIFYASLQVEYVPLMGLATWINFALGRAIATPTNWNNKAHTFAQQDWNQRRLRCLWLGIILNVLLLLSFKYIPFILDSLGAGLHQADWQTSADWVRKNLIAPLGLSFFCFESIAYLVDVYRGAPACQSWLEFSSYKLFFPKLISGPITSFHAFAEQEEKTPDLKPDQAAEGLWLIATGAAKKALLADYLGHYVDLCFQNLERAGSSDLWLATIAYGLQLYLDFSAYVDIVRGSTLLMGITLPENFDFPYLTTSIAQFWRRWHMTLGNWLRNYLYFPLGGSRRGLKRTCLNLMIVMLVAGIWHGAAWGFILWGTLHGLALVIHRLNDALANRFRWLGYAWRSLPGVLLAWFLTQAMVFWTWIFFRLPDLNQSGWVIRHLWGRSADIQFSEKIYLETMGIDRLQFGLLLMAIFLGMGLAYLFNRSLKLSLNWPIKLFLVPLCLYLVWLLSSEGSVPYIYFDF